MKVDVRRLLEREPHEQQRMLSALRFADLAEFRAVLAHVCGLLAYRHSHALQGRKRWAWLAFARREFARDAEQVPEAAIAQFLIHLAEARNRTVGEQRVAAAAKGKQTRRDRLGTHADDWQAGRRRLR